MKKIILILSLILSNSIFSQSSYYKDIVISKSNIVEVTDQDSNSLNIKHMYKISMVTRNTGVVTGSKYLVWASDNIWNIRNVSLNGTTSNHPTLVVDNNTVKAKTNHANNYTVRVFIEEYQNDEDNFSPNMFGADNQWQRTVNSLGYTDGNVGIGIYNPESDLHIYKGNSGATPHGLSALTVEDNTSTMVSILTPNNKTGYFGFADAEDSYVGGMQYNHISDQLVFRVNNHTADMVINKDGYLGIGTTTPNAKLEIKQPTATVASYPTVSSKGDVIGAFVSGNNGIEIGTTKKTNDRKAWILARHSSVNFGNYFSTLHLQPNFNARYYRGVAIGYDPNSTLPVEGPHLAVNGNVGIGTSDTHGYKLAVAGKTITEEVKVQLQSNWPDYVFENDYELPTLKEVEQHINKKGHLKDIPSAKEVEKNGGFELGEMNRKLLQKIEELTLYTIQQQKELDSEKEKNTKLEERVEKIEQLLQKLD